MPITKGSAAAHERARKAAETRKNNARLYGASPRRAISRMSDDEIKGELHMGTGSGGDPMKLRRYNMLTKELQRRAHKQTPKRLPKPKQSRLSIRNIRKADTAELRAAYERMNASGWQWGPGDERRYYGIQDELRLRANPNTALAMQRAGYRDIGGKKLKKRQIKTLKTSAPHTAPRHRRKRR